MSPLSSLLFFCLALSAGTVSAAEIFSEDFQSGQYANWTSSGDGEDAINLYQANYSLRLDGLRQSEIALSTEGFTGVSLSMALTGAYLVYGDTCHAEYSTDGGASWSSLGSIGSGQSGGGFVSFNQGSGLDNQANLRLRFRAYTLYDNYCYGDNVTLTGTASAAAALYSDDFQDGSYADWSLSGNGNDAANLYQGNYSLRLDGLRQATQFLSSSGYQAVSLSGELAALYLVNGDHCYLEVSANGGQSWQTLLQLSNGQDSGQFQSASLGSGLDDNANLQIRARAYSLYGNYCYLDNVSLAGQPISGGGDEPELRVTGSGNLGQVPVGQSAQNIVSLSNNGDAPLDIGVINAPVTPFSLLSDNCSGITLAENQSCQLTLGFTPTTDGGFFGSVSIPSNDTDQTPYVLNLSGTGLISGSCDFDCLGGSGNVSRSQLTYSQLTGTSSQALINYSHYGIPANGADPDNSFSGNLSLTIVPGTLSEQGTSLAGAYTDPDRLPPFSFSFVQYGTHLVPLERQIVATTHPSWEWILLPGRVWQENGDNGYSRVALPFALQEVNANCTHNGVMTFLFKDDGSVSRVAYQIAQETCEYFKFNLHGKLEASYTPAAISGATQLITDYVEEVAGRLPVKAISELASDYPGVGLLAANIGSDQTAGHLSAYGVLYQGTHYQGNCSTRQGDYPFCAVMALPSYSTAKSMVGGIGLMRLEQKYGGSQQDLKISDYVSECPASRWGDVTLEHALDMATGNYDSAGDSVDEGAQATIDEFFLVGSHAGKISHACDYPRKVSPGSSFVYHTSDTYILSRAMQQVVEANQGSQADYFRDMLVAEIYQPLGLSPLTWESKRTYDGQAQVWGGYGLSLHGDDFLKVGAFLSLNSGQIGGQTMLDPTLLADALQQTSNRGLTTGTSSSRYQNGFWAYDLSASTQVACANPTWVPYMSGFGGIGLVMLPNGMVYYYVSDNNEYGFTKTVKELNKISPVCN
ncbi:choice-of-anchor D domain-containing protein [Bowmanella dokdonensis]|uniref:Choice-of-anchor D domain-containing protein n=1 Tax=Bowmanella dokdonensis TaxID=751969 RepID=A0A939ILG4_9ALTE|nr:choice-of-anchor D domain-containing protein [Bowmanella dokdonensis]MBN7824188.1 choice-of-anchor D domain-containing protein [Bowmanella dokdonensis]